MRIAAEPSVAQVRLLQPGTAATTCAATPAVAAKPAGHLRSAGLVPVPKAEWLQVRGKPRPTLRFDVVGSVSPGTGFAAGKVLLLLEFPGREHFPSTCTAKVNGRDATLEIRSSAGHIGYAGGTHGFNPKSYWAGLIPYESEWTWYICPVGGGESQVHFSGTTAMSQVRIKAWLWSDRDCTANEKTLPIVCPPPASRSAASGSSAAACASCSRKATGSPDSPRRASGPCHSGRSEESGLSYEATDILRSAQDDSYEYSGRASSLTGVASSTSVSNGRKAMVRGCPARISIAAFAASSAQGLCRR